MEELKGFHPAVQVTIVVAVAIVTCVFIWQMWKTYRKML